MSTPPTHRNPWPRRLGIALAILAAGALIVWLSPAEQTLGAAVKTVYVHVALSRAGALLVFGAGLLGLAVLITDRPALLRVSTALGVSGLGLYTAGFLVSLIAQISAWGGIAWREPRVAAALNGLAFGALALIAVWWLPWRRARGAVWTALAALLGWMQVRASSILHPGAAISGSDSPAIRLAGFALLALALVAGAWLSAEIGARPPHPDS